MCIHQTAVPDITVTAILKEAVMLSDHNGRYVVGDVFFDGRDRWSDGTRIFTTYVTKDLGGDIYLTRSGNVFAVESWKSE